jgi:hypothetical protein
MPNIDDLVGAEYVAWTRGVAPGQEGWNETVEAARVDLERGYRMLEEAHNQPVGNYTLAELRHHTLDLLARNGLLAEGCA